VGGALFQEVEEGREDPAGGRHFLSPRDPVGRDAVEVPEELVGAVDEVDPHPPSIARRGAGRVQSPSMSGGGPETDGTGTENVCRSCGACCAAFRVSFHWSETDAVLPDGVPAAMTRPLWLHEVYMEGSSGPEPRCAALGGVVGEETECTIYARRPSPCRRMEPGSDQCRTARGRHGLPPLE
jgi:Fe-S-cluster containining protein